MGFFSWLTADTKKPIRNVYTGEHKPVYLLQPGGKPPIEELTYEGYGVFGGTDAYKWLAHENLSPSLLEGLREAEVRTLGVGLDLGSVYRDRATEKLWLVFHTYYASLVPQAQMFHNDYQTPVVECGGESPNDLIKSRRWVEVPIRNIIGLKHPLKFSFNREAVYENLPASNSDPEQGYF